jgi:DNA modification methylase
MSIIYARLVCEDCMDQLAKMEDTSVDLVVTSPPYNINLKSRNDYTVSYFDDLPESEYRERVGALLAELERVITPRGSIWFNMKSRWLNELQETVQATVGTLEPPTWILDYTRGRLFLKNLVIWNYDVNSDTQSNKFHPRYEFFFWFVKDPKDYTFYLDRIRVPNKTGDKRNNPNGANPTDVWYFPLVKGNSKERNLHPAQFPEAMIDRIVQACSDVGNLVLDPFCGSGTTLKVAVERGRNALGFEIEPMYIENAKARLESAIAKKGLPCELLVEGMAGEAE